MHAQHNNNNIIITRKKNRHVDLSHIYYVSHLDLYISVGL